MKLKMVIPVLSVFILGIWISDVYSAGGIKQRMIDRLPVINDLKARGIVGENNLGFLEFIGDQKEKDVNLRALEREAAANSSRMSPLTPLMPSRPPSRAIRPRSSSRKPFITARVTFSTATPMAMPTMAVTDPRLRNRLCRRLRR